jgi:hypothetical protein
MPPSGPLVCVSDWRPPTTVDVGPVRVHGIDEGDAEFDSTAEHADQSVVVAGGPHVARPVICMSRYPRRTPAIAADADMLVTASFRATREYEPRGRCLRSGRRGCDARDIQVQSGLLPGQ